MHSFYELMPLLKGEKFCLTTVDTIFDEAEFTAYIENFKASEDDVHSLYRKFQSIRR